MGIGAPPPSDVGLDVGVAAGQRGSVEVGVGVSEDVDVGSSVCCEGAANATDVETISSNDPKSQPPHSSFRSISSSPNVYEVCYSMVKF